MAHTNSIFRIASITKPIVAAGLLTLVEDGRVGLHDPVDTWLPELAKPMVVRTPSSSIDDLVPADRPITVLDLLTFRTGYGFPSDFSLPQVQQLFTVQKDGRHPATFPPPDEWIAALGRIPLLYQPGRTWLYDTSATIEGILISRVTGRPLPDVLAERIFVPLGMVDTAFHVPAAKRHRFARYYEPQPDGSLRLVDPPNGQWSTPPALPLGNGGLASTIDDWYAFARMLLGQGTCRRPPSAVTGVGPGHDHKPVDPSPARSGATSSSRGRAGATAARSTSPRPSRGTSPAATAGPAAPAPRLTSFCAPALLRSCSPRSATPVHADPPGISTSGDSPAAAQDARPDRVHGQPDGRSSWRWGLIVVPPYRAL